METARHTLGLGRLRWLWGGKYYNSSGVEVPPDVYLEDDKLLAAGLPIAPDEQVLSMVQTLPPEALPAPWTLSPLPGTEPPPEVPPPALEGDGKLIDHPVAAAVVLAAILTPAAQAAALPKNTPVTISYLPTDAEREELEAMEAMQGKPPAEDETPPPESEGETPPPPEAVKTAAPKKKKKKKVKKAT